MKALLREPFFHFVVAGILLFGLYAFLADESSEKRAQEGVAWSDAGVAGTSDAIEVEREALLAFVQNRTKNPDAADVSRAFDALDQAGRDAWVERFVREEALVREARKLGLDQDDELIRRRLVQQMEFLALGAVDGASEISQADLEAHYVLHAEDHRIPASLTFTHVFIKEAGDFDSSGERAQMLVAELNAEGVSFRDAMPLGDRFLYNRNYVDRTLPEIESHFGAGFAQRLLTLPLAGAGEGALWSGPYQSEHGWHAVLLTRRTESQIPPLDAIEERLREEIRRARRDAGLAAAVQEIVSDYRVSVDPALGASASARGGVTR
jgi:hypothetical protein